jgi:arogenate dehydrogenase (NADP+)
MNIGIVGLGLIGGSLALDFKAQGHQVFGMSRREETCNQAIARGIVTDASPHLNLMAAADVVFICTPIGAIVSTVTQLIPHLSPTAVLTDVGSVKAPIVQSVSQLWANFVGGHPMSGTAEQGLDAAQLHLFVGNPYVLTPTSSTPDAAIQQVETLVRSLKSSVYFCRPEEHDRAVAWISHLPVMVSASLISACLNESDQTVLELAQSLASSGFRDTSRVGGGNPELGVMMAQHNRSAVLQSLQAYRHCLDQVISEIEQENWQALTTQLQQTQQARPKFLR